MCITCLAFSAMTLFSPVTEAPQPTNVQPISLSNNQPASASSLSIAEETRISISRLLKQIPNSPETLVLREEFKSLQAKLAGVKDDTKADAIIDDGLNALSKRVMAEPNADRIIEILFELRESKGNQKAASALKLNELQRRIATSSLKALPAEGRNWGWLS